MAFAAVEYYRIEADFIALGGGDVWSRVEDVAWQWTQREKTRAADKQKAVRATVPGKRAHAKRERTRRVRNKQIVRLVRCCRVCRKMFGVTATQVADGTGNFCTPTCAGRWRRARHNPKPTRMVAIDGKSRPLPEWAKRNGLSLSLVYKRLRSGMSAVEALTAPKRRYS